jgi:hypothetical protein
MNRLLLQTTVCTFGDDFDYGTIGGGGGGGEFVV